MRRRRQPLLMIPMVKKIKSFRWLKSSKLSELDFRRFQSEMRRRLYSKETGLGFVVNAATANTIEDDQAKGVWPCLISSDALFYLSASLLPLFHAAFINPRLA